MTIDRKDIAFASGTPELLCRGWLYPGRFHDTPVIVMAHGLGGVKEMRVDAYAEHFAARGYACLVFDYRHLGTSDGLPRQIVDIAAQLDDWRAAIDYVRELRPSCPIVLWGTSLSGGHVLAVGAEDSSVAAVISQCPHTSGLAAIRQLDLRTNAHLAVLAVRDIVACLFGSEPVMVALAAPHGRTALMNSPGSYAAAQKLMATAGPVSPPDHVAARIGLFIGAYSPGRYASGLRCPTLFCLCAKDKVAPASSARRIAQRVTHGEIREYPIVHFDIYLGEAFAQTINDQIAFLERHVPVGRQVRGES